MPGTKTAKAVPGTRIPGTINTINSGYTTLGKLELGENFLSNLQLPTVAATNAPTLKRLASKDGEWGVRACHPKM